MPWSATIDVPDLAEGIAFYGGLFGLAEIARPVPVYAVLEGQGQRLGIMQKHAGSQATPAPGTARDYGRHWTPVHLDFHVADFDATLSKLADLGGIVEQRHDIPDRPPVAFCGDPFGHGFCILGTAASEPPPAATL